MTMLRWIVPTLLTGGLVVVAPGWASAQEAPSFPPSAVYTLNTVSSPVVVLGLSSDPHSRSGSIPISLPNPSGLSTPSPDPNASPPLLVSRLVPTASPVLAETSAAQDAPALRLVPVLSNGSVRVELDNILGSGALQRSLEGGLPVRIMLVVELWRDRFFDAQEGRFVWRATVHHDPLTESYRVESEEGFLRYVDSLGEAGDLLESWISVPLRPPVSGNYYYLGRVEIETLSLSDLEELRRWLQGDLAPAMDQGEPVGSAVGRGMRRVFVRVLGLPTQRHEARSVGFDWVR